MHPYVVMSIVLLKVNSKDMFAIQHAAVYGFNASSTHAKIARNFNCD